MIRSITGCEMVLVTCDGAFISFIENFNTLVCFREKYVRICYPYLVKHNSMLTGDTVC